MTFKRAQIFYLSFFLFLMFYESIAVGELFFFFFPKVVSLQSNILPAIYLEAICTKKSGTATDLNGRQSIQQAPASLFSALLLGSQYLSLPAGLRKSHYWRTEELRNYWSKSQTHLEHLVISCEKDGRAGVCERPCASMRGRRRAREWGDTFRQMSFASPLPAFPLLLNSHS